MTSQDTMTAEQDTAIPEHIAEAAVLPKSYRDEKNFYDAFAWLRQHQPLGKARLPGYDPAWLVTKHADIMSIERQAALFKNMVDNPIFSTQAEDDFLKGVNNGTTQVVAALTHMDNPDHAAYRGITADYFTPPNIQKLEQDIREIARAAVAKLVAGPRTVDFVKDFALYFPLRVILSIFGLPEEELPRMLRLTQEFFGANDPEEKRSDVEVTADMAARQFHAALQDYYSYFEAFTRECRETPRNDLMSLIANHKVDGEYISDFFANGYYVTIVTAGHDTTSSTSATALLALIEHPEQFAAVKADPSLIPGMIDEALRWATPVRHFMRTAMEDTEVRGRKIAKGDRLMLCYPSANRDEDTFENPDAFDIRRKRNRQLAFGWGPHSCLGQHLAKLELKCLFEELLPHLDQVGLAGTPKYVETNFVGGLKSLLITFSVHPS